MSTSIDSDARQESLTNILLRLPVKSLLRFKRVCKSWNDQIKSSSFIKNHYENDKVRPRLLISKFGVDYRPQPPLRAFTFFLLPETLVSGIVPTHQKFYRHEDVDDLRHIYGPVDGLYVVEKGHFLCNVRFALWNPSIKHCRLVPFYNFELERFFDEHDRVTALGLDMANQDYKLLTLRIYTNEFKRTIHPKVYAAVYSSNNDSWKLVEEPISFPYNYNLQVSLNYTYIQGIYYWLCLNNDNSAYSIWTFNFTTEVFEELDECPAIPSDHWGVLMMRGGILAAMSSLQCAQPMTSFYDIWSRIGEKKWIKVLTINPQIDYHFPVGIWEYDKVLFELTQTHQIVFYDHSTTKATDCGFNFSNIGSGQIWPFNYKESLVPINRKEPTEMDNMDYFLATY